MNAPFEPLPLSARSDQPLVPSLERRRIRAYIVLLLVDVLALLVAFAASGAIYMGLLPHPQSLLSAQLLLPLFLTIALYHRVYSIKALSNLQFAVIRLATALMVSAALLNFIAFYTKSNTSFSRVIFTLGLALAFALMAAARVVAHRIIRRNWGPSVRNVLVIDDGGPSIDLANSLKIVAAEHRLDPLLDDPHALDRLGRYLVNQDKVVVSCPQERRDAWSFVLKAGGVQGELISEAAHQIGALGINRYEAENRTGLIVSTGPLAIRARVAKRVLDLAIAVPALVVLLPLLLVIAALIKLEDGGAVFFMQRRLGKGNCFFQMYKFRSMRVENGDADGNRSTSREDDRITRIGRFIRRTSIDELPQLLNVLRGDMSIVGPRPHALGSQAGEKLFWEVDGRYWHRHALKPGLTGLAQVRGLRGATELESDLTNRLQSDLEYIATWNPLRDIAIVLRTLAVLRHDRAF